MSKLMYERPEVMGLRQVVVSGIAYDGYYVTRDGDVYSDWKRGREKGVRGVEYLHKLKPRMNKDGYLMVVLCKDSKQKGINVHRLVAEAFIPNPDGLPQVNHKDEVKNNNRVENLEWCTPSYNINYGTCRQRISESQKGENNPMYGNHHSEDIRRKMSESNKGKHCGELNPMYGKHHSEEARRKISESNKGKNCGKGCIPICQLTLGSELVREWRSGKEAGEVLGLNQSNITACCRGKTKTAYGYRWAYKVSSQLWLI